MTSLGLVVLMRAISSLASGSPGVMAPGLDGRLAAVEPQIGFPRGTVGAVAGEAVLRQDRPDVAVVFQFARGPGRGGKGEWQQQRQSRCHACSAVTR